MATNDFQVFAGASGANVITQAQYAALPNLTTGFQSGLAQSNQMNKVLRQTTSMAAMLGQFIADQANQDATDDGTTGVLQQRFIAALRNLFRTKLTADLNLYVNPGSGNDSNNGLATTTAFRTIAGCVQAIYAKYDLSGFKITVNLADGTYTAPSGQNILGLNGAPQGASSAGGAIAFVGNVASPQNVILSAVNGHCMTAGVGAWISVSGVTFTATGSGGAGGIALVAFPAGVITIQGPVIFGACGSGHMAVNGPGDIIINSGVNYTINGNAPYHLSAAQGGTISFVGNNSITVSGNPSITNFALTSVNGSVALNASTTHFTGTATGTRYNANLNGAISTNGGGASVFPGTIAGVTSFGGQYN